MMHIKSIIVTCFLFIAIGKTVAQQQSESHIWNPTNSLFPVIEGQAWPNEVKGFYQRFPARLETQVRRSVWQLSENSAGLLIRFRTNAKNISIRYQTQNNNYDMPHMPATGVSGLDLYAIDSNGKTYWCRGNYSFSDTIQYSFNNINNYEKYHKHGREYRLYLPLYNSVKWLEIITTANSEFTPLPVRTEKPIVAYGTSITQGACASRPGMAWTAILGRKLDRPVINLGFSGNAILEEEIITAMAEIDAKLYILDCMPNMVNHKQFSKELIIERLINAVKKLTSLRPKTPIIITEHEGYADGMIMDSRRMDYERTNEATKAAFTQLKQEGFEKIYLLTKEDINQPLDFAVDGTHPTDLGMVQYAQAYEKLIREVLNEKTGFSTTTSPCTQLREPDRYDWEKRHRERLKRNQTDAPKIVFLGNSITHFWGGNGEQKGVNEKTWAEKFGTKGVQNFGCGWDRIENVLWRIQHDELDGFNAKQVWLMIGTNNLEINTDVEIIDGIKMLVEAIRVRQPFAKITVMAILPRKNMEMRIEKLNQQLKKSINTEKTYFINAKNIFTQANGKIDESLFSDGLHPNAKGYALLADFINQRLFK